MYNYHYETIIIFDFLLISDYLFRMHSNYQEMQADLQCLANQQNQLQHSSLQTEMMQHYPGMQSLQQSYQNSNSITHNSQNYLNNPQLSNNCGIPDEHIMQQNIEHNNGANFQQWHSLMNHNQSSSPVFNNYSQLPHEQRFQQQTFINQRPHANPLPNSIAYPVDHHSTVPEPFDQLMQPNKETQSQQFYLHQSQPKFRKSWDIAPPHNFAQESQNVWNGR